MQLISGLPTTENTLALPHLLTGREYIAVMDNIDLKKVESNNLGKSM